MRKKRAVWLMIELAGLSVLASSPALRFGGGLLTIYGVCMAAAALLAVILFEWIRLRSVKRPKDGPIAVLFRVDALELALCCIPAALLGARGIYVLFRPGYYLLDIGVLHALCLWEGGFLLWGAVAGAMAAAVWLGRRRKANVPELLDQMAAPGLFAVALCRMAEFFAGEGLGPWMENPVFARFPFAVVNLYGEWQMAVFLFEALAALLIMWAVLHMKRGEGKRMTAALVLYACTQVVFESLRMDSCLRIGFVRVSQVLSAAVILAVTGLAAYHTKGKSGAIKRCCVELLCTALIGGMEWALDKTQVHNVLIYGVMALICIFMAANALYEGRKSNHE